MCINVKTRYLLLLILGLFCFACGREEVKMPKFPSEANLTEEGEAFLTYLKNSQEGEEWWKELNECETLLANQALVNVASGMGIHYLVPLQCEQQSIEWFALFQLKQVGYVLSFDEPIIIESSDLSASSWKDVFNPFVCYRLILSDLNVNQTFLQYGGGEFYIFC